LQHWRPNDLAHCIPDKERRTGGKVIKLELDVNEVNVILNALGQMPFVQVQALIMKIQGQATPQVQEENKV
jgi:hypothetical protein